MNVLLLGANGQLGKSLQEAIPPSHLQAIPRSTFNLEESDPNELLLKLKPQTVINAAAYTDVNRAESEEDKANNINNKAVKALSIACKTIGANLIHISTDFVFDGLSSSPYTTDSKCNPLNTYGMTKLRGENSILDTYPENSCIIRTAWLYSCFKTNFVTTMLNLMKKETELKVVTDQISTPTSAESLSLFIKNAIEKQIVGIYHWTDAGVASWYDFAIAIREEALACGLLKDEVVITPILGKEFNTPTERPHFSVLDKSKSYSDLNLDPIHWRIQLRKVIKRIAQQENQIV